ncbi:hypothetical protein P7C70_g5714, partial [Phenoliferia sp. Uapishka_3]
MNEMVDEDDNRRELLGLFPTLTTLRVGFSTTQSRPRMSILPGANLECLTLEGVGVSGDSEILQELAGPSLVSLKYLLVHYSLAKHKKDHRAKLREECWKREIEFVERSTLESYFRALKLLGERFEKVK